MSAQIHLLVVFLEVWKSPSHYYFLSETARPQIGLWQKIRVNPNYLVVFLLLSPLAMGVGSLSREGHMEEMMVGDDPMSFLQLHLGADTRLQGRVGMLVQSLWRTSNHGPGPGQCRDRGRLPLEEINQSNMFELKEVKAASLLILLTGTHPSWSSL
jgi:hypothetical protein